jgi:hypothetical protein
MRKVLAVILACMKLGVKSNPCRDINPRKLGFGKLVTLSL